MKFRAAGLCLLLPLSGCTSLADNPVYGENGVIRDRSQEYAQAEPGKRLEMPANLQEKQTQDVLVVPQVNAPDMGLAQMQETVPRPEFFFGTEGNDRAAVRPLEGERVILVDEPIDQVWRELQSYWRETGQTLASQDARQGVMETDWIRVEGQDLTAFQKLLNTLKFNSEANEPSMNKLRVRLRPDAKNTTRTAISVQQVQYALSNTPAQPNWTEDSIELNYTNEIPYSMLQYLSRGNSVVTAPTLSQYQADAGPVATVGSNTMNQPLLNVKAPLTESWKLVNQALDRAGVDVGTRDIDRAKIYLTYRTVFREKQSGGILDWFRNRDVGPIKLFESTPAGSEADAEGVVYSSDPNAVVVGAKPTQEELQAMEGFKIWVGDRVVYVFGQDNQKRTIADGETILIKRFQLKFSRARSGVLVSVLNDKGEPVAEDSAEELLWVIKDNLSI